MAVIEPEEEEDDPLQAMQEYMLKMKDSNTSTHRKAVEAEIKPV